MKVGPLRLRSTEDIRREGERRQGAGPVSLDGHRGSLVALPLHEPCSVNGAGSPDWTQPGAPIVCTTLRIFEWERAFTKVRAVDRQGCGGVSLLQPNGLRIWKARARA